MYYDYYLYYVSYLGALYNGYPLVVRITAVMVLALLTIVLFGIARLLYIGYRISRSEKQRKKIRAHFDERLVFVMTAKNNYDVDEIRELLHYDVTRSKKWKADVLTDIVLTVKNESVKNGNLNELNYRNCLEALRLMGFWEKRMRTPVLPKRREALQVVGDINNGVNSGILSKSMFHKDKDLRKTARDLYASQESYNPFRFMEENFDEAFTQLDKLRLHATLVKRSQEIKLPNLLRWINNSRHVNYIQFIIQEIGFFKQLEACPALLEMLSTQENRDIRAQIILTLGDLQYNEGVKELVARFPLESAAVREAIVKAMARLRSDQVIPFLTDTYSFSDDDDLKIAIARSIKAHGKEGEILLLRLQEEAILQSRDKEKILLNQVFAERFVISA
ncbi:HEAT repeat domain-containing protein [Sphingobacterium sp. InxBP1]|uniref:HEAT repeat domain-containing protein n=1 Tax=Sphingobacterium sp. InxBP1 TaxID=2870328 RepID=UPI002243CCC8|nr:HEAT repeat domain-containing protein [Sphingobacterium sp. InxBP1]MCW8313881.1 HEAT repeat domain-containing protein [Sphingobacterium sp. InxBP1]